MPRSRQRGVALLLVLWVFTILGVLALDFARYMRDDAMAAVNFAEETRGYYLALAGMNRALWDTIRAREQGGAPGPAAGQPGAPGQTMSRGLDDEDADTPVPVDGEWHDGDFAGGHYQVRVTDEDGLFPINNLPLDQVVLPTVITALLAGPNAKVQGVNRDTQSSIDSIVAAIMDWRDADDETRPNGAESDYYLSLNPPYRAKNGFFDSPEELLLVRGVTPELFYGTGGMPGLRDLVSVFNRSTNINVRTAPPALLAILSGQGPDAATAIEADRAADPVGFLERMRAAVAPVIPGLGFLAAGDAGLVDQAPHTVLLEARADTQHERNRSTVAAVIELASEDTDGPKILRWLDRAPWTGMLPDAPGATGGTS
ncbi:MAG TPA: hypothetical protein VKZ18_03455 [Polyangia bacterium]|nr:hypothetical protein [Polyangia bacterium]